MDVANEKFLVHLLTWIKSKKASCPSDIYRSFMIACVYVHYTLNLNFEFPLFKSGGVFNWKKFFEGIDSIDESGIAQIVYRYQQKKDEVGR